MHGLPPAQLLVAEFYVLHGDAVLRVGIFHHPAQEAQRDARAGKRVDEAIWLPLRKLQN